MFIEGQTCFAAFNHLHRFYSCADQPARSTGQCPLNNSRRLHLLLVEELVQVMLPAMVDCPAPKQALQPIETTRAAANVL